MTELMTLGYDFQKDEEIFPEAPPIAALSCPDCDKKFTSQENMELHRVFKHFILPHKCPKKGCGKTFIREDYLKNHIELIHKKKGVEKAWKCTMTEKCKKKGAAFETEAKLKIHQKLHDEKTMKCQYCEKMFNRKDYLETHERTHTKEKIYPCRKEQCDKSFTNTSSRKWHEEHHH